MKMTMLILCAALCGCATVQDKVDSYAATVPYGQQAVDLFRANEAKRAGYIKPPDGWRYAERQYYKGEVFDAALLSPPEPYFVKANSAVASSNNVPPARTNAASSSAEPTKGGGTPLDGI